MEYIKREIVIKYHLELKKNEKALNDFITQRGIKLETIIDYEIGWDATDGRYTIPIKDSLGEYVNIRKYKMGASENKMISYGEGYGEARLYPYQVIKENPSSVVICEGELDALVLNQSDMPALTGTCGAMTWKKDWNPYFEGKNIAIIFDCDEAGRKGADNLQKELIDQCGNIRIIDLELDKGEDITDWFVAYKKNDNELEQLIKNTEVLDAYKLVDLAKCMEAKYYDQRIKFSGIIVGKDLSPFLLPYKIEARCEGESNKRKCVVCPLAGCGKLKKTFTYETDKMLLIDMINSSNTQVIGLIKMAMGLPKSDQCREMKIKILEKMNVEDVRIIPEINFERIEAEYVIRKCYYFGLGIQTNQSYICRGTTVSEPSNQMGVHLIKEAKGNRDNISRFIFTDEIKEKLKIFEPDEQRDEFACWDKIKEIQKDFTYNVTKMYQREHIIHGTELLFHSALAFRFLDEPMTKAWLEMTCVGDTQCGKTETIRSLTKHYRAGEFLSSAENASRAGILGGVQQSHSGRWTVTWGKIPINDKGQCTLDEVDELVGNDILGRLSGVRSTGVAEIVMIQPQRTMARTRLIFIANPMHGDIDTYNYGVETLKELFVKQQDISRIDFAVFVSRKDVPDDLINKYKHEDVRHTYTSDLCHHRVMWAWNRKSKHIIFRDGAEQVILDNAKNLGRVYNAEIPLVIGGQIRMKIARMAVAQAICLHSTDQDGENVLVYPSHVHVVTKYLHFIYNNPICGYKDLSDKRRRENKLEDTGCLDNFIKTEDEINLLLDMGQFKQGDFINIFNADKDVIRDMISQFWKIRAIKMAHGYYKKTPAFIRWLKSKKQEISKKF